ncbi:MAG: sugar system component [Mycobacteriales bacterium]|jgi:PTS system N-acetylglucosamine-specific IIA component
MTAEAADPAGRAVLDVLAPVTGRVLPLAEVPDPVFSAAMVGPGLAVAPALAPGAAVAPVTGRIVTLHPHAFVIEADPGRGVLVHLGLDTVQLKGAGFTLLAAAGDVVTAGQPVVEWDPAGVIAGGRSAACPVIALDSAESALADLAVGTVTAGTLLFRWT